MSGNGRVQVIAAGDPGVRRKLAESWASRRLVFFYAAGFNRKRFVRTWLGSSWIVIRPTLTLLSQMLLFGGILRVSGYEAPYPVVLLVGFATWQLFGEAAFFATRSLEVNRSLLRRMHVPRGPIIVGSLFPSYVDLFVISCLLALVLLGYFVADGQVPLEVGFHTLFVPLGFGLMSLMALGVGLLLAVPGMQARDVRFGLRYVLAAWFIISPVVYPLSAVPGGYRTAIELNPVTLPLEIVKRGLLGADVVPIPTVSVISTLVFVTVLIPIGIWIFFRHSPSPREGL